MSRPAGAALDPAIVAKVRGIVDAMPVMRLTGARLTEIEPGRVVMDLPFNRDLTQQHGFHHAGITAMLGDTAGGCAAATLMALDQNVLTVEFKINLMAPARGDRFRGVAEVTRAGRTLTVVDVTVNALAGAREKPIARLLQTCIAVPDGAAG